MYRVLAKVSGSKVFQGTGQTSDGAIIIVANVIHQSFYSKESAEAVAESLRSSGIETKIIKGN